MATTKPVWSTGASTVTKTKGSPRNQKNIVKTATGNIAIYASPRISKAIDEVIGDMTLYDGVRMFQVIEAAYIQGKKDGARTAFEEIEKGFRAVQKAIPHKNPGKPKKR